MANLFQAVAAFGPRLEYNRTLELPQIAEWLVGRTGLNEAHTEMTLKELRTAVIYFGRMGMPMRIPGIGRVRASMDRYGMFHVNITSDPVVVRAFNAPGSYTGSVANAANVGLDNAGYKALWDDAHPDDLLELAS